MTASEIESLRMFLKTAGLLKEQMRNSWSNAQRRESVAEHSWRLSLMTLLLAQEEPGVDPLRALELSLVHDLGEALNGDTPAPSQHDKEAKSARERADMAVLVSLAPARLRSRITALWEEYEAGITREAAFVRGLDKIETILQHLDGHTPDDFDFGFNLDYGREWTDASPLLRRLRDPIDADTARRSGV